MAVIAPVDQGLRCITYDRRGHGRSDEPRDGYDYDTLSDDLADLIDTLDLRAVTLVGHSMGNGEIVRYLTRHGDRRVARAALVAPLGLPDPPRPTHRRPVELHQGVTSAPNARN